MMRKRFFRLFVDIGLWQDSISIFRHTDNNPGYYERRYRFSYERCQRLLRALEGLEK